MGESSNTGDINFANEPAESSPLAQLDGACETLRRHDFTTTGLDIYRQHPNLRGAHEAKLRAIAVLVSQAELFANTGIGGEVVVQSLVDQAGNLALQTILQFGERVGNFN